MEQETRHGVVYVVQNQHRWDKDARRFVPKFDLRPAECHGELVELLTPTAAPFKLAPVLRDLKEKLQWFCDEDRLLLIGNPVLIGAAVAVALKYNKGRAKVLQWSGTEQKYIEVKIDVGEDEQDG